MKLTFFVSIPGAMRVGNLSKQQEAVYFEPLIYPLRALADVNAWHHRTGVYAPLYASGVVYKVEPPGHEDWKDIPQLYADLEGDCEDLACARSGELLSGKGLILRGGRYVSQRHPIKARPCIKWQKIGDMTLIHVMVLHPDGSIEDPSKLLGMRGSYQ